MQTKSIDIPVKIPSRRKSWTSSKCSLSTSPHSKSSLSSSLPCSYTSSYTYTSHSKQSTDSNKNSSLDTCKLILQGGPFYNLNTMIELISNCIPELETTFIEKIVKDAHNNTEATIMNCPKNIAERYCYNLIENGLCVVIQ